MPFYNLLHLQGEDIFMAAKREVKEETGVSINFVDICSGG